MASPLPAWAQDLPAGAAFFEQLQQLQDANLGLARQIAETERRAAAELQQAIDSGAISNPAHQAIARTFIQNALTLATVMLSPLDTRQGGPGDTMVMLIQRNIAMVQSVGTYAAQDSAFAAAMGRYTVLQMQAEDLVSALQSGWGRYGDALQQAANEGVLPQGAFDPGGQSWGLQSPDPAKVDVAVAARPATPMTPPSPDPVATNPAAQTAEGVQGNDAGQVPAPEPAFRQSAVPVPQLTGDPDAPTSVMGGGTPPAAPPGSVQQAEIAPPDRLSASGPLGVAPASTPRQPIGDWVLSGSAGGASASTKNLNSETAGAIAGLSIRCSAGGAVEYAIESTEQIRAFRVYTDDSQYRSVRAEGNIIAPDNTAAMRNTLRLAYDWSQAVPDSGRQLTIRADTMAGTLALFSPNGYLAALEAVSAACASAPVAAAGVPTSPESAPGQGSPPAASLAPAPEQPASPAAPQPAQATPVPPPGTSPAPIPLPRLNRPLDIMGGG